MFGRKNPEVLVVGAGPVGLFAALLLARRGVRVEIIDRDWRTGAHSYALALHPRSLRLLDELGLKEAVLQEAYPITSVGFYGGGERRAEIRAGGNSAQGLLAAVLRQDALEALLENALASLGVKVRWNHELSRLQSRPESAVATVHRLVKQTVGYAVARTEWTVGRTDKFEAAFVIGADGHRSTVRRLMGIDFQTLGDAQQFAVFECRTGADPGREMRVVFTQGATSALWPMSGGCRWSFELLGFDVPAPARTKDRIAVDLGAARYPMLSEEFLERLLAERAPWFDAPVREIPWRIAVPFDRRLAGVFGKDRVWLAGDAGHTAGPVGMQSMNAGLGEAYDLASLVAEILRDGRSSDCLRAYGERQLAQWRRLFAPASDLLSGHRADPWVVEHSGRILACLPASGDELAELAGQLHLGPR